MKTKLKVLGLVTFILAIGYLSSCKSSNQKPNTNNEEVSTIWINATKAKCNAGLMDKECYLIKKDKSQEKWEFMSDEIEGFQYEEGYEYEIMIRTEKIANPPMDASSLKYSLLKVISKTSSPKGLSLSNQWIISSFHDAGDKSQVVSKDAYIIIDLSNNNFKGNGSCNKIAGNVQVTDDHIKFGKIISTKKACPNLQQESKFVKALEQANTYKIVGCELFLFDNNVKILSLESCR